MTRLTIILACLALTSCASLTAADLSRAADIARQIEAGVRTAAKTYCGSPALQKAVMKILRGKFPAASILCQGATSEPLVTGVPGW